MKLTDADIKAGDCLQVRGDSFFSKGILFFQNWHTKDAFFSHTACIISKLRCIEALMKSEINYLEKYNDPKAVIKVYSLPLTQTQQNLFVENAFKIANVPYGWFKIPLFALDSISTKIFSLFGSKKSVFFFTKTFGVFHIPVCSQLYTFLLYKAGYNLYNEFGEVVSWRIVSPDYLDDLMQLPINKATVVFSQNI